MGSRFDGFKITMANPFLYFVGFHWRQLELSIVLIAPDQISTAPIKWGGYKINATEMKLFFVLPFFIAFVALTSFKNKQSARIIWEEGELSFFVLFLLSLSLFWNTILAKSKLICNMRRNFSISTPYAIYSDI